MCNLEYNKSEQFEKKVSFLFTAEKVIFLQRRGSTVDEKLMGVAV